MDAAVQLVLGERGAASGGGGKKKVLRHPLEGQGHPVPAEALLGLLQALPEGAAGQGGGDHHQGVLGAVAVLLGHDKGPVPAAALAAQLPHHLLQGREPACLKVADHSGKAPGGALLDDLLTEGRRGPQSIEGAAVQQHHPAPWGGAPIGPEQVRPAPHAVDRVGRDHGQALDLPQAVGRDGHDDGFQ